jgi:hypothetical protein
MSSSSRALGAEAKSGDADPRGDEHGTGPRQIFPLATMTADIRALTAVVLLLPIPIAVLAHAVLAALLGVAPVPLLCLGVWLWLRPRQFVVDDEWLTIEWPLRSRRIARSAVREVKLMRRDEFRRLHGYGVRVGAGGLWGGFGLLKTPNETFSMWISRTDRFVVVSLAGEHPLLVTPNEPESFVAAVERRVSAR